MSEKQTKLTFFFFKFQRGHDWCKVLGLRQRRWRRCWRQQQEKRDAPSDTIPKQPPQPPVLPPLLLLLLLYYYRRRRLLLQPLYDNADKRRCLYRRHRPRRKNLSHFPHQQSRALCWILLFTRTSHFYVLDNKLLNLHLRYVSYRSFTTCSYGN